MDRDHLEIDKRRGRGGREFGTWWTCIGLSMDSIEFQTLRDLQTFNIKQINQLCRRIIPLGYFIIVSYINNIIISLGIINAVCMCVSFFLMCVSLYLSLKLQASAYK